MFNDPVFLNILGSAITIALIVGGALKIGYTLRKPKPLPVKKPMLAFLPKYSFSVACNDRLKLDSYEEVFSQLGFEEVSRGHTFVCYSRGSEIGEFSIEITKVNVNVNLPLSDPLRIEVEYGVLLGVAFDTGDLWKFCSELSEKLQELK